MKLHRFAAMLLLLCSSYGFADIKGLQFEPKQFDENTYIIRYSSATMKMLEVKTLASQSYDFAFQDKEGRFEIRYILFSQVGGIQDNDDYKMQATLWAVMVISNITGNEDFAQNTSAFGEADVKKEFNADIGFTNFSQGAKTDFTAGYQYIMINFYCRKNLGIMCQTILFNDINWIKTEDFLRWFHGFNFY